MAIDEQFSKGYAVGYSDGVRDTLEGKAKLMENRMHTEYPVKAMAISSRAINCLLSAGCSCVSDVVALSEYKITTLRNVGNKTAREIACWLVRNGFVDSAWNAFL